MRAAFYILRGCSRLSDLFFFFWVICIPSQKARHYLGPGPLFLVSSGHISLFKTSFTLIGCYGHWLMFGKFWVRSGFCPFALLEILGDSYSWLTFDTSSPWVDPFSFIFIANSSGGLMFYFFTTHAVCLIFLWRNCPNDRGEWPRLFSKVCVWENWPS